MDDDEIRMHLRAGFIRGRAVSCGLKLDYRTEGFAMHAAAELGRTIGRELEPYPCVWCREWHIGRVMTDEERARFSGPCLPFVWHVRDSAGCALVDTADRDRVALLLRLYRAAQQINLAYVPDRPDTPRVAFV